MSCSICQSMTFQAIAGSRLDGSVRYESVSVPPCVGVFDEALEHAPRERTEVSPQCGSLRSGDRSVHAAGGSS